MKFDKESKSDFFFVFVGGGGGGGGGGHVLKLKTVWQTGGGWEDVSSLGK